MSKESEQSASKKMTLFNPETEKEFAIVRDTPNMYLRDRLSAISLRYQEENADRMAALPVMPSAEDKEAFLAFFRERTDEAKQMIRNNPIARKQNDLRTIEMAREIVNTKRLKEDEAELVEREIDSEFWFSQDLEALGEWVDGFCTRNGI